MARPRPTPPAPTPLVDRVLGAVGLARRSAIPAAAPRRGSRVYAGAAMNRLTVDFKGVRTSADQALKGDFNALRERARELERDNPIVTRYRELQADNVVGPDGIKLMCLVRQRDGKTFDAEANTKIETAWDEWSLPEYCDVAGQQSLTDLAQGLVERWRIEGEGLVRLFPGFHNKFGFALQAVDSDLLDYTLTRAATDEFGEIRMGVERDRFGKPTYYWMWTAHPNDVLYETARRRERVPASEIIHIYTIRRPGQSRGVTDLAPVMIGINMLGEYIEAELAGARAGAGQMFFVIPGEDSEGADPDGDPSTPQEMEAAAGMGYRLAPGDQIAEHKPEHPVAAFGVAVLSFLRHISTGLHTAYASLTGDLSNSSYSSARIGMLSERDGYRRSQRVLAERFYRRVYGVWLKYALIQAIDLPYSQLPRYQLPNAHRWMPRGFPWIDPLKDIEAAILAIENGLDTHTDVCAADGGDFEKNVIRLAEENDLLEEYGVSLAGSTKTPKQETPENDESNGAGDGTSGAADDASGSADSSRAARGASRPRGLRLLRERIRREHRVELEQLERRIS